MPSRYKDIPIEIIEGKRTFKSIIYPEIPLSINDVYVITTSGDRFDLLANRYYGDYSYWWVISIANEDLTQNSLVCPVGTQIRIPAPSRLSSILKLFNKLNQ